MKEERNKLKDDGGNKQRNTPECGRNINKTQNFVLELIYFISMKWTFNRCFNYGIHNYNNKSVGGRSEESEGDERTTEGRNGLEPERQGRRKEEKKINIIRTEENR